MEHKNSNELKSSNRYLFQLLDVPRVLFYDVHYLIRATITYVNNRKSGNDDSLVLCHSPTHEGNPFSTP